jgi:hypothetical protein
LEFYLYKIDSKGLNEFRIDVMKDDLKKVDELISSTEDVSALVNLYLISEMAGQRLDQKIKPLDDKINLFEKELSLKEKQNVVLDSYQRNIYEVMH